MWTEYPIFADLERQKQIIQNLKAWIEEMEDRAVIHGYAFNYYSGSTGGSCSLNIRFDAEESNFSLIEDELRAHLRAMGESDDIKGRDWPSDEYVKRAYEIGSRWAFLYKNSNRVPQGLTESELHDFLCHLVHGVLNSLGINYNRERAIHLDLISRIDSR